MKLLSLSELCCQLHRPLPLLVLHLVPPQPVLVELREAVHHDRDGEREDEDAGEGAEASDQFSQECLGVEVISDSCNGHKAPPKAFHKGPCIIIWNIKSCISPNDCNILQIRSDFLCPFC